MATFSKDNPDANCLPIGLLQQHTHSQPRKIVQTRDDMLIAYEANGGLRHILLDGRPLPPTIPSRSGRATRWAAGRATRWWCSRWGFRDDGWLDVDGSYFGTTTRITERFRRVTYGRLELDVTVEDAKAYTRPWTVRVNYRLIPDQQLIEFVCNENEQSSKHYVTRVRLVRGHCTPQCAAFLDQVAAAGGRPLHEMTPAEARARRFRRSWPVPNSPCTRSRTGAIPGDGGLIPVRVYRPVGGDAAAGARYFHGGGFVLGGLDMNDRPCRALANGSGCVVISVDYRLAPEHPFPAAADDAFAATVVRGRPRCRLRRGSQR